MIQHRMSLEVKEGIILITEEAGRATVELFNALAEKTYSTVIECDLMSNSYLMRMFTKFKPKLSEESTAEIIKNVTKFEVA